MNKEFTNIDLSNNSAISLGTCSLHAHRLSVRNFLDLKRFFLEKSQKNQYKYINFQLSLTYMRWLMHNMYAILAAVYK